MSNLYRPLSERAKALLGEDPVERDWTAGEEADMLSAGHVEIVPRPYKVLVNNCSHGEQGSTVDLALPVDTESALILGGILERDDPPAPKKAAAKKK